MSIAIEKDKQASERFLLVRLNPARYVEPILNVSIYEISFPYPINRLERNGIELTNVSGTPANNDEWHYDEETLILSVKLASPPNDSSNVIIAYYYLFYTGTIYRSISEDPEDSLTAIREWQPKIDRYPSLVQSFDNIINGVFTIADTTISIINEAGQFQEFLSGNDSFYNKSVDIWLCINSADNIQKIFTGTVKSLSLGQNTVSLRCVDSFNTLVRSALMGDAADESYFRRNVSSFPDLDPNAHEKPLPYIVGSSSRYKTSPLSVGVVGIPDVFKIGIGHPAYCTSFSADISATTNRTWGTCRIKGSVATEAFGAVQAVFDTGTGYYLVRFASSSEVQVGDTIKWVESASTYYGLVNYVGAFTYSAINYNLIFSHYGNPFSGSSSVSNLKSFGLIISNASGDTIYPIYERDYICSESSTSGGNKYISIVFVNNFEANHASFFGSDFLNPQSHEVAFRTSNTSVQKHGTFISDVLDIVALPVNSSTITAANALLPVNCRFHIPNFDEDDYDTYLKYVQDVLKSTLGFLRISSAFEVEYNLLSAPSSSDVRDNFLMLDGGTSCDIEYADITTEIIAFNPHNDSQIAIDGTLSPSETRANNFSRYLHGLVNVDRFRHVLEEISSNIDEHISLKSNRKATYRFQTSTQDIDTELGDDLSLSNKIVLGASDTIAVKVVTIEKSPSKISIEATDLRGL